MLARRVRIQGCRRAVWGEGGNNPGASTLRGDEFVTPGGARGGRSEPWDCASRSSIAVDLRAGVIRPHNPRFVVVLGRRFESRTRRNRLETFDSLWRGKDALFQSPKKCPSPPSHFTHYRWRQLLGGTEFVLARQGPTGKLGAGLIGPTGGLLALCLALLPCLCERGRTLSPLKEAQGERIRDQNTRKYAVPQRNS